MAGKERIKELLDLAGRLVPAEREAFLARECGGDEALRREVEELLAAGENSPHLAHPHPFHVGDEDETIGKVLGGQYVIQRRLGGGGMGQVYLAQERGIPRQVAVKIFEMGFEKEVEALGRVDSARVVKIHNTGVTDDGRPYMVMELLKGETLADLLERRGLLPHDEVAQLMREIAEAASELHETRTELDGHGIIHRDLKPSNVMVEQRRGGWQVKLFDLGIARVPSPLMGKSTSRHVMIGTPRYMSPEQFHGEGMEGRGCRPKSLKEIISPATDVYALGVIAYEMLTGRNPFHKATNHENVAAMQIEKKYVAALNSHGEIPAAARNAVLKAMAFCPEQRYQKADEFGAELADALTARPQFWRKRLAAAAAVLLSLLLGVAAFMWWPDRAAGPANSNEGVAAGNSNRATEGGERDRHIPTGRAPAREALYWLETQQRQDDRLVGKPRIITPDETLTSGWNFKVYFNGRERGYLYLINDGPSAQGRSLQLLFPIPNDPARDRTRNNGTSEVVAGGAVEAFDGVINRVEGTEHLWIVWSTESIPELERLTTYADGEHRGRISEPGDAAAVRAFLSKLKQAEVEYDAGGRGLLRGEGNVLAKELLLRRA